ncbi:cytochrome P450 4d8-like [Musca domestica]|uniref:Cytochrome P450 4d8-like n=1 Tax=Musca domestica TaxID=7370 RepID=A0A9J7D1B1_MUSDO|nr:cytochrome P450 4d8-like [Musca domestica]
MRDAVKNIGGPFAVPILGCIHLLAEINPQNIKEKGEEIFDKYGRLLKIWAFNRLLICSSDVEFNEQVFASNVHISKVQIYGVLQNWLGLGLLLSDGKKWHSRRKIITPTFHFKILEQFLEVFDSQSTVLLDCLAEKADGKSVVDVYQYISLYTLDIIAETAMGTKVHAQTNKTMDYTTAVKEMTDLVSWRVLRLHLNSDLLFTILHPFKKMRQNQLIKILHNFTKNVIEERRAFLEKKLKHDSDNLMDINDVGSKKRCGLLDVLLQSTVEGQPLSDEDIREEVDTFMFEGHDTTASALSFLLHLLSRDERVQNKLLAEVREAYGYKEITEPFTLMNLNELKYLDCVIKEGLRLFPSVPIIGRSIKEDFKYKHSKYGEGVIPKGTELIVSLIATLRNPERFDNPHDFIPERYENSDGRNNLGASAFSAGARNCIGQKFALYVMKITMVKLIHKYEFLPLGEPIRPIVTIAIRSENGMQLGLRERVA